jgi:hypothetical protein
MDVALLELAARQRDLVSAWQLRRSGWTWAMVEQHAHDQRWRRIHSGVYALTQAPLTREQRRLAATLTAPDSFLTHFSAGAHYGIHRFDAAYETIVRPGNRGRHRSDGVLTRYSRTLDGETTAHDGIPITTATRTVIDLGAARPLREALRLKLTTPYLMAVGLEKHKNRRGAGRLKELNDRYSGLPYSRCRSNAEAKALEIVHDAGKPPPLVNHRINGEEADLTFSEGHLIIEIDGPQYHRITAEDARKQALWEAAGYTVRRISSDAVFGAPAQLIALIERL